MQSGLWDKNRREFKRTKALGHCDALAALMYGVRNVEAYAAINPIPPTYQVDLDNTLILNPNARTGSAQVLAEGFGLNRRRG